jgi:RecA-family ATPase
MSAVISKMEWIAARTGVSVLFLHHSTKSAALNGQVGEQQSSRGSSVLVDNVRWQGFLATMSKEEAKRYSISEEERKFFVKFGVSKQNYSSPISDIWYRRHHGGVLRREDLQCSKGSRRRVENGN